MDPHSAAPTEVDRKQGETKRRRGSIKKTHGKEKVPQILSLAALVATKPIVTHM